MPRSKKEGKYYEVRLYKSHDADLLSLWADGVKVSKLLKQSMENYVHRKNIKYRIPECRMHRLDGSGVIRYHLLLTDPEVIALLERVRKGRRNQFFKNVLREALLTEPMGGYFLFEQDAGNETQRLQDLPEPEIIDLPRYTEPENGRKRARRKENYKNNSNQAGQQPEPASGNREGNEAADTTGALDKKGTEPLAMGAVRADRLEIIPEILPKKPDPQPGEGKEKEEEDMLLSMFDNLSGQI